ncbi:MAG TPA: YceI family protein [candidate division Zixibacteria bacterium]|jgi:polyisoprenoid-binding protein YceI
MKRLGLAVIASLLLIGASHATEFKVDRVHSNVGFTVTHMTISRVSGSFSDFSGTIVYDPADTAIWAVEVTIQTKSVNTQNENRDGHLRSADFFDVENNPEIKFTFGKMMEGTAEFADAMIDGQKWMAGNVVAKGNDRFDLHGLLSIRGVTKPVILHVEKTGMLEGPGANKRVGFSATTTVKRMDYGVSWSKTLDAGGLVVGDDVKVTLDIQAMYRDPAEQKG